MVMEPLLEKLRMTVHEEVRERDDYLRREIWTVRERNRSSCCMKSYNVRSHLLSPVTCHVYAIPLF